MDLAWGLREPTGFGGLDQTPGDLGAGSGGLAVVDETAGAIGFDFLELMAVNGTVGFAVAQSRHVPHQRSRQCGHGRGGQQCQSNPQ